MPSAIGRRIIYGMLLVLAVVVLDFLLIQAAPGDVVDVILTEAGGANPAIAEQIRVAYGLDKPIYVQLFKYLVKMLSGDLGFSYYFDRSVLSLLLSHLPSTLLLTISALIIAVFIGTLLGVWAALKPQGVSSHLVTIFSLFGYATPVFWLGMMILLLFSLYIPIFPAFGIRSVPTPETTLGRFLDILHHLVLPVFTLSMLFLASYSRLARASMLDVLGSDYIRTARSKGLSELAVIFKPWRGCNLDTFSPVPCLSKPFLVYPA
jgi:peptide/nickel transport system permease protein